MKQTDSFTEDERAAMKARALELKAEARMKKDRAAGEKALLEAIAKMKAPYKAMGGRLHEIISKSAPQLMPKTWYGMPAYANRDGKVVCFFRGGDKFKERYMTFGFNDVATVDDGSMWPVAYAITKLSPADEARIAELVKKAVR